jgi:hypothetical protein
MLRELFTASILLLSGANYASYAVSIDVSTTATNPWLITGAGASASPAFDVLSGNNISLTNNVLETGTFIPGGSLANFNGFWYADLSFVIPANATNISLNFTNLNGDDRVVLQLNGSNIGNYFLNASPGTGVMSFPPGPPDKPFTFTNQTSGIVTSGFLLGQNNDLRLIVNNTDSSALTAQTFTFQNSGDGTEAGLVGAVTYSIPEPTSVALIITGMSFAVFRCSRRKGTTA